MALEHLILDPDESANLWRDCGDKRSYALWGLIPFKNKEVLFLQLEKLPNGVATNACCQECCTVLHSSRNTAESSAEATAFSPKSQSWFGNQSASFQRVSTHYCVTLKYALKLGKLSASLLLDNWSSKGNLNMITQLLEMPLNAASVRDLWRYQCYLYLEMHIRTRFSQSSEN